ncbi:MAG: WD repeat-containing protein 26 [Marteilia pararefringens]
MLRCKFSPCGNYLVIGGEKGHCSLYEMNNNDFELSLLTKISGISSAIIDIVWSPDSTKFIVIGEREKPDGVVYNLTQRKVQFEFNTLNFSYLHVCDWFPDCQRFIAGGRQGYIYIFVIFCILLTIFILVVRKKFQSTLKFFNEFSIFQKSVCAEIHYYVITS